MLKPERNVNHTYVFGSVSLADGVHSKQTRVSVVGIEGRGLQQSQTDTVTESFIKAFYELQVSK